jgi:hypothetical protein
MGSATHVHSSEVGLLDRTRLRHTERPRLHLRKRWFVSTPLACVVNASS